MITTSAEDEKIIKALNNAVKTIEQILDNKQWHNTALESVVELANYAAYDPSAKYTKGTGIIDWARDTIARETASADAKKAASKPAVHAALEKCAKSAVDSGKAVPPFAGNKNTVKSIEGVKADARFVSSEMVRKYFSQELFASIISDGVRAYDAHYLQQALSEIVGDMTEQIIDETTTKNTHFNSKAKETFDQAKD